MMFVEVDINMRGGAGRGFHVRKSRAQWSKRHALLPLSVLPS